MNYEHEDLDSSSDSDEDIQDDGASFTRTKRGVEW